MAAENVETIYALVGIRTNAQPSMVFASTYKPRVEEKRKAIIAASQKAGGDHGSLEIVEIHVDETMACDISNSYDHFCYMAKLKRDLASELGRDVDDIPWDDKELYSLMDECESDIYNNVSKYGCDEDWSFDEAESSFFPRIKALAIFEGVSA